MNKKKYFEIKKKNIVCFNYCKKIKKKFKEYPKYQTSGSAGLDLRAMIKKKILLYPNKSAILVGTGLSIFINNKNFSALVLPRSGLSHNNGIILGNSIGLIDSDYQGEIKISLYNYSKKKFFLNPGDRIAQLLFLSIVRLPFKEVKEFNKKTVRNFGGFGSSGIK